MDHFLTPKGSSTQVLEIMAEWIGATTEFPQYDMSQMLRHSHARTPHQPSHRPKVPETTAQQDEIIKGIAETEEEELDAQ